MMEKIFDFFHKWNKVNRHMIPNLIYVFCGIFEVAYFVYIIFPFKININKLIKLEILEWFQIETLLNYDMLLVKITFRSIIAHMVTYVVKGLVLYFKQYQNDNDYAKIAAFWYTVCDLVDLIGALMVLFLLQAVFIQYYQTGVLFCSNSAKFIYFIIAFRTIKFIIRRHHASNLKLICVAIEKYNLSI